MSFSSELTTESAQEDGRYLEKGKISRAQGRRSRSIGRPKECMTMIERKLTVASVAATAQSCRIALFGLTRVKVPRNNISVTNRQDRNQSTAFCG